jgi:hypothetical protein
MEDDLNFLKLMTTPIFSKMEEDINVSKIEDDLKFVKNGRQPQFFSSEIKTISIFSNGRRTQFLKRKDNIKSLENRRRSKYSPHSN